MSTRATVIWTPDEHWYTQGTPEKFGDEYLRDVLNIDIGAKSILRIEQDEEGICIEIDPRSELYRVIMASNLRSIYPTPKLT